MATTSRQPERVLLLLAILAASGCASSPRSGSALRSGLVVEKVGDGGFAALAGIQTGDILLRWRRGSAGGELVSPIDLDQVRVEEAPRGPLTLEGWRGEGAVSFEVRDGSWGLGISPRFGEQADQALVEARQAGGAEGAERLLALARRDNRPSVRAWLLVEAAEAAGLDAAGQLWAEAVAGAGEDAASRAWVHERHGKALFGGSRLDEAAAAFSRALESEAEGGLTAAADLNSLGEVARESGDLEAAEQYHRRALEIRERLAPGSLAVAASLNNLGIVTWHRGDLEAAEGYYRRALEIKEHLAPGSLDVANSLNNLGIVAFNRGDLEAAERYLRRALEIKERLAPGSLGVATSLNNLGNVALNRGDLEAAEGYHRRALEIKERLAPDSLALAHSLSNLGTVARDRDDLEAADGYFHRALEIRERLAPGSLAVADSSNNLGVVAKDRGDLETAEGYHRRALEIRERLAPGSLAVAESLNNLGVTATDRNDLEAAERYQRRALELFERLAPGSTSEATSLRDLAFVLRAAGHRSNALAALRRAVAALEAQQRRLGGTPEQLGEFRAQYLDIYRDLVDLLVEEGMPEEAFGVLESARARALLAMLAERDVVASDVPADLERERRIANADHDRAMAALGELAGTDEEERVRLLDELDGIRHRQEEIRARVRAASPRLAELRYPESLDLAATRQALDPGTLLLVYSLGVQRSFVFAVGGDADLFFVFSLPVGEEALREEVKHVRRMVQHGLASGEAGRDALQDALRSLSATLLGPVAAEIAGCSRLVVVPDGPLHLLPFAALLDPTSGYEHYLVEGKPISVVASATVLAQLKRQRRPPRETRLIAFGDPSYPSATSGEVPAALEQAVRGGLALDPLPATRAEVEGLANLLGEHATSWLGPEATEERAKAVGQDVTIVHFAVHGLVDEYRPLSSALALTIPEPAVEGRENGLLQAWEVFEQVRLDADLVVLSACQTALGKEVAGEGIVGLTRAFQYAGARSVLASLWSVADETTAELMRRFYTNLEAGTAKDEALRQAQLAFIRGPLEPAEGEVLVDRDLSHPYIWAAFQLYGDWR